MLDPNDHRQIAKDQKLLHFQDEAPGMVFWHPRGLELFRCLERAARDELARHDYREVRTPELMRQRIWQLSGHWQHFDEGMFKLEEDDASGIALRPVNCPGHVQIYRQELRSFRDLPLRLAEFGVVHRKEPSGALQGLFRLREFTQDDGHVFCRPDQLLPELARFCRSLQAFYRRFGFDEVIIGLSTRPPSRIGDDASWDRAESALASAARELRLPVIDQPGEGAFYGPKLEFKLRDRLGRVWQCGTIQVDFAMPERFELAYTDSSGERRRPVMLHRALYGSVERFIGVLLEHHRGRLPAWLAPEQAHVLPVSVREDEYAAELARALRESQVRVVLTDAGERLASRVAEARRAGAAFVLVVGPQERTSREVSIRQTGSVNPAERVARAAFDVAVERVSRAARSSADG
jgi:threonyl-tRNA synthetase